mgnify:CR=1 FL=1
MMTIDKFRPGRLDIAHFLELAGTVPVIDVRSPSEYAAGHMPGALNIPVFNDSERAIVGTRYKKEGRIPAIVEGLRLIGPEMSKKLEQGLAAAREGQLLVYCWRGGMRSESMAWLLSLGGINTAVLEGGYKAYRNHLLSFLAEKRKIIVLGGMTGSGKTHILRQLKALGEQVIDLEGTASHKGSAFGSLGQPPQPSTEHFANMLFDSWRLLDPDRPVWVEDESRNIGSVFLPEDFFSNMQNARVIAIMMDVATRMPRLLEEYSCFPAEELKNSVTKISRRMGGDSTREALEAIDAGNIARAIEISLKYYDKAYEHGRAKKVSHIFVKIYFPSLDTDKIAKFLQNYKSNTPNT